MDSNVAESHDRLAELISIFVHENYECPEYVPTIVELQVLEEYWGTECQCLAFNNANPKEVDDAHSRWRKLRELRCTKTLQHLAERQRKIIEAACREKVMSPSAEDKGR